MGRLRFWIHEQFVRLDGMRARRGIAFFLLLGFVGIGFGPTLLRAARGVVDPPLILVIEPGIQLAAGTTAFRAAAQAGNYAQLNFFATETLTGRVTVLSASQRQEEAEVWVSESFAGEPGKTYAVRAQGVLADGEIVASANAVEMRFGSDPPPPFPLPTSAAIPDPQASVAVRIPERLEDESYELRAEAPGASGLAFLLLDASGTPAELTAHLREGGDWAAAFRPSEDATIRLGARATLADGSVREARIAAYDFRAPRATGLGLVAPLDGDAFTGEVPIALRASEPLAAAVFEIAGEDGWILRLPGVPSSGTDWTTVFDGAPGTYTLRVAGSLQDGRVISGTSTRAFSILPAGRAAPASERPFVELSSPVGAPSAPGPILFGARIRNAEPAEVTFLVRDASGTESLVAGRVGVSGSSWTALFDGAPGRYAVRARVIQDGLESFSKEETFTLTGPGL